MSKEKEKAEPKKVFEDKPITTRKRVRLSRDGQYILIDVIKTVVLHRNYVATILEKGGSDEARIA